MAETLDEALESLRRQRFYEEMAQAEQCLHQDPENWGTYLRERDQWLHADGTGS